MIKCKTCGTWAPDGTNYCPSCGTPMEQHLHNYNDGSFSQEDIQSNRFLAIFSYLGILCFIPLIFARNSRFARFHANQGLVLFLMEAVYNLCLFVLRTVNYFSFIRFGFFISILNMFSYVFLVFAIWGIVNVCTGKAVRLPIIGGIQIFK